MKPKLLQASDSAKNLEPNIIVPPTMHPAARLPAGMPSHLHSLILLVFAIRERWKQDPSTTRLAFFLFSLSFSIPYIRIRTKMITERNRRDRWNERAREHEGNGIGPDRQTMPRLRHFAAMRRRKARCVFAQSPPTGWIARGPLILRAFRRDAKGAKRGVKKEQKCSCK